MSKYFLPAMVLILGLLGILIYTTHTSEPDKEIGPLLEKSLPITTSVGESDELISFRDSKGRTCTFIMSKQGMAIYCSPERE